MIRAEINGNPFEWKNELKELTLGEFYSIEKFSKGENEMENWVNIIHYLSGIPIDVIEDMKANDFKVLVQNHFIEQINERGVHRLEIEGRVYPIRLRKGLVAKEICEIERAFFDEDVNHWTILLSIIILHTPSRDKSDKPRSLYPRKEIYEFAKKLESVPLVQVAEWLALIGIQFLENFKIYDTSLSVGVELDEK